MIVVPKARAATRGLVWEVDSTSENEQQTTTNNNRTTKNEERRTKNYSCRSASTGLSRAARIDGTIVARNETMSENAEMIARSMPRVMKGIEETKYTSAMSGEKDTSRKRVTIQQMTTPRRTPVRVPAKPTIEPYHRKMRRIIRGSAPIEARMPISLRFSCTVMISVETMLNVETNTISPMTMKSTSC